MEHNERFAFAQALCDRIVQEYGDDIIIGGVFGSTARGTDTEWSDLEMLFVVTDECDARGQHLLFHGMAVGYSVLTKGKLEQTLSHPRLDGDMGWPFWMGVLRGLTVLYGEQSHIDAWLSMGRDVPEKKFKQALKKELSGLITESYGRLLSCKVRDNGDDWFCAVLEVLFEMRDALCLLNKSWVMHDYYQGMIDTFRFSLLPERYREIVPRLWHVKDIDEAIALARELVKNFNKLLLKNGIQPVVYTDSKDIPV